MTRKTLLQAYVPTSNGIYPSCDVPPYDEYVHAASSNWSYTVPADANAKYDTTQWEDANDAYAEPSVR